MTCNAAERELAAGRVRQGEDLEEAPHSLDRRGVLNWVKVEDHTPRVLHDRLQASKVGGNRGASERAGVLVLVDGQDVVPNLRRRCCGV